MTKKPSQFTSKNNKIIRFRYFLRNVVPLFNYSDEKKVKISIYLQF